MKDDNFSILIVEDDMDLQEIYREQLESGNRTITQVYSAEQALVVLNKATFDAIILDMGLPGISGGEFLKIAFEKKDIPRIPVFIVSGQCDLASRLSGRIHGAEKYFVKPVEMSELSRCITDLEGGGVNGQ